jgi:hypothetical protein
MESYHVISGIKIKGSNIISEANGSSIFEKQGTADGACGPYSLFMVLKILGELSQEDINEPENIKKSRSAFKLMNEINQFKGLIFNGTDITEIYNLISNNFKTKLVLDFCQDDDNSELINFIVEQLDYNKPTIVRISFPKGSHWFVAIGYSVNEKGKNCNLLLLDPSGDKPTVSPWNSIVEIGSKRKGDYSYHWHTNGYNISFDEALSICSK